MHSHIHGKESKWQRTSRFTYLVIAAIILSISSASAESAKALTDSSEAIPTSETKVTGGSQDVSLTIYNQNFGLVKDVRSLDLHNGVNYVSFEDVAAQIDPTTVNFTSLTAPNMVTILEQNYQYDLLDPNTILSKSVGKNVKFKQFLPGGQINEISGTLLNPPQVTVSDTGGSSVMRFQGLVLKTASGILLNPEGQAELAELPEGLVSKPSLLWKLDASKGGNHKAEIAYQTSGLNWHCDYVAVVNQDDTSLDLTGWVTLDNKSGTSYKHASLKLLAGDVHKVVERQAFAAAKSMAANYAGAGGQFQEQSFAEYHLYKLAGRTDVNDNETKQMSLFNTSNIACKKKYVFDSENIGLYSMPIPRASQKVNVKMEIVNSKANGLGIPLPKGKIRVYKKDEDGALQFIGEDSIDHTPRDEKLRVYIGDAFDIVADRKQTSMQRESDRMVRASYEIDMRNHKDKLVTVTDVEHAFGDWEILSSSQEYAKKDSHTFEFAVNIPANGETKVTYTIEARY